MDQQKIQQELQKIYQLPNEPYWYAGCLKWAEKTQEYINQGKSSDEAGFLAAKEIWKIEDLLVLKSRTESILSLLEAIRKK